MRQNFWLKNIQKHFLSVFLICNLTILEWNAKEKERYLEKIDQHFH